MELGLEGVGESSRLEEVRDLRSERDTPDDDRPGLLEKRERAELREDEVCETEAGEGGGGMRLAMDEASTSSRWKPLSSSSSSEGMCSLCSS